MTERASTRGAVVVTGASSGIGQACALHLDRLGFRVFAGVRSARGGELLREKASERLTVLPLDVTETATIAAAAAAVAEAVGGAGLAGLVNNAGICTTGPLELFPVERLRSQFEVNVIGQIAVTQAFLSLLREGHGRIVVIGSIAAEMSYPFMGPYAGSKAALHALAAALRVELRPWRIPVSIVVAGTIATPLWEKSLNEADEMAGLSSQEAQGLYGRAIAAVRAYRENTGRAGSPPQVVAAAVEHALTAREPKTCYLVGRYTRLIRLLSALPDATFDRFMTGVMRLPRRGS